MGVARLPVCVARLHLLRHGKSVWNLQNRFTGWVDVALSERGVGEAAAAADGIVARRLRIDYIVTSELRRAVGTADEVIRRLRWSGARVSDWRFNERHYGALQGRDKSEASAEFGEAQVWRWRRSYDAAPPPLLAPQEAPAWFDGGQMPTGESLAMVAPRVLAAYEERIAPQLRQGRNVLLVAHGNSLRTLMKFLEGIDDSEIATVEIKTGEVISYKVDGDMKFCRE